MNRINGRELRFGDREQIEWLKRQARLKRAAEEGLEEVVVEEEEFDDFNDHPAPQYVITVRCPVCLARHGFATPTRSPVTDLDAPCGASYHFEPSTKKVVIVLPESGYISTDKEKLP